MIEARFRKLIIFHSKVSNPNQVTSIKRHDVKCHFPSPNIPKLISFHLHHAIRLSIYGAFELWCQHRRHYSRQFNFGFFLLFCSQDNLAQSEVGKFEYLMMSSHIEVTDNIGRLSIILSRCCKVSDGDHDGEIERERNENRTETRRLLWRSRYSDEERK